MLPYVVQNLLGPLTGGRPYVQGNGQLALRFPGDMCDPGTTNAGFARFEGIRRGWHIDGLASDFVKV